jgi:hypothetical protein
MIIINGRPLSDLVAAILDFDGYTLPAAVVRETLAVPNTSAQQPSGTVAAQATPIDLTVEIRGTTLADRTRVRDALLGELSGLLEIEVPDEMPGRVLRCLLRDQRPTVRRWGGLNWAHGGQDLVIPLRALDGAWLDIEPTILALSTVPVACPIGTVSVAPRVEVFGATTPVVNPVVQQRTAGGTLAATLPLVGSLGAGVAIEVDTADALTYRRTTGTRALALDALGPIGASLPLLDPADASPAVGRFPTLALTATTGTPSGRVIYRRAY